MSTFSINLSKKRKEKKLTQQQMADKLNIKIRTYQAYEEDRADPDIETFIKINQILGVKAINYWSKSRTPLLNI
ncbi:MAG: helix-turn-helix transcriptional regulator [Bacteroidetes bacterium]|nr:helix-turn-helix transcriptional regulator [Bacteroidota bacterium]